MQLVLPKGELFQQLFTLGKCLKVHYAVLTEGGLFLMLNFCAGGPK